MTTLFSTKCRSTHLLTLVASLLQASYFLFTPSQRSSGNNLTVSSTRTFPTPTIKPPTRTTPHNGVNSSGSLGIYLLFCSLLVGFLFGFAMVCSRTGSKTADSIHPSPRRASSTPPVNAPTNNDDKDRTDADDSEPDNSGNEGPGDGDGSDDTTDEQEADNPSSETSLHKSPDPEDPPPPPPSALDENDDDRRAAFNGPALSFLHFLLGVGAGLLARLVTMNATSYRRKLHRLFRKVTSRPFSIKPGPFWPRPSHLPTVGLPCSCHHQPFSVATAEVHNSSQPRRIKVSLPASFTTIIKYTVDIIAGLCPICLSLVNTIRPPVNWLIHAMAQDLVVVGAYLSLVIDRMRAIDIGHGSSLRIIVGCSVLLLVVLEVYSAGLSANPAKRTDTDLYRDEIRFPFADVDLPLEDPPSLQPSIVHPDSMDHFEDNLPFHDVDFPLVEVELDDPVTGQTIVADPIVSFEKNDGAVSTDEIEPVMEFETEHCLTVGKVFPDCGPALYLGSMDVGQVENLESNEDIHEVDNRIIVPSRDVDLPLVKLELDDPATGQTIVVDPIASFENNDGAASTNEIELVTEFEVEHCSPVEEVSLDSFPTLPLGFVDVKQVENFEVTKDICEIHNTQVDNIHEVHNTQVDDIHEVNNTPFDELTSSAYDEYEGFSFAAGVCPLSVEVVKSEGIDTGMCPDPINFEEDPDAVLNCLAGLFDYNTDYSLHVEATEDEEIEKLGSTEGLSADLFVGEDPDTILECIADFFDLPVIRSFADEEGASGPPVQDEFILSQVSPKGSGDVCIRAFTSCETFAAAFGFENEQPLEFLRPLPARLERLLPSYSIFTNTPARSFTLDAPPATPTTPYARWVEEDHQTTPFISSPFCPSRIPPQKPPTIVIPSPTSSEGTQLADESPATIRARRLDRKWAKMMAKRQRNEARNFVPRVRIEETSFSSLASDSSVKSFFDPHASINQGIRDTKADAEPARTNKWRPRCPGDPVPKQRRWRNKDVLVGAGEDESYGAVAVAVD